jgi:iron complex outermembrane receptor protein
VYGARLNCPTTPTTYTSTSIRDTGLYARDKISFGERWQLLTGLRYDNVSTYSTNLRTGTHTDNPASATTGSAALMASCCVACVPTSVTRPRSIPTAAPM